MLSIVFDSGFFIDVLTYILNSKDTDLGKQIIQIYNTEKQDNSGLTSPVNRLCIEIITNIVKDNLDINNAGQLAALELKIRESRAVKKDPKIFDSLQRILLSPTLDAHRLSIIRKTISDKLKWYKCYNPIKRMTERSQIFITTNDEAKKSMALSDIEKSAYELLKSFDDPLVDKSYLEYINFSNLAQIEKAFSLHVEQNEKGMFFTGQRGLNDLLGNKGGISTGQLVGICAPSSHHKTGTLLNFVRWVCTLNKPWPDRSGKPSVVYVSLEEDINTSVNDLYNAIYVMKTGKMSENKTTAEKAAWVQEECNKNGFILHLIRAPSREFTIHDYCQKILDLIDQGFDVQMVALDYLGEMKFEESGSGNRAQTIKETASRLKNFGRRQSIVQIVGIQANEDAIREVAGKGVNPVKRFSQSIFQDSKSIYDALDVLIYQYIEENHRKRRYLTYGFGKYRGLKRGIKHRTFAAYGFNEYGLPDDIHLDRDLSVNDIFADVEEESSESDEVFNMFI